MNPITIKTIICTTLIGLSTSVSKAENTTKDWAETAAVKYEEKAQAAVAKGNESDAKIYTRMAAIKREAGVASKNGEKYHWDEYHKLQSQLSGHKNHQKYGKKAKTTKKKPQNDWAEEAAVKYEKKAEAAAAAGNENDAKIYTRMAAIKREAGVASKNGEKHSWDEYHALQGKLTRNKSHKKPSK